MSKTKQFNPDAAREIQVRFRINDYEQVVLETWLAGITPERAEAVAKDIARRLTERAPFDAISSLLRAVTDLPDIAAGAPRGNQNHAGKRGGNVHTARK